MKDTLYIALRYLVFHKAKTFLLIVSLTLILYLPLALQLLASATEAGLLSRAAATPLVLGGRGSSLDLVIDACYFHGKKLQAIKWSDYEAAQGESGVMAVPLYTRFNAREYAIAATTLGYFDARNLQVAEGSGLRQLGDCVLGARVAQSLGLHPGDSLLSTPENLFDIAGVYPLKMKVSGVLAPSHSPDDNAVFVDIKTAWIIEGLGHGHQDLAKVEDKDVILMQSGNTITANAKLPTYTEITPENIDSFHFHGERGDFPISAVLIFPDSRKTEDLLRGRYQNDERLQIAKPETVVADLNATLFRIQKIMNFGIALVAVATFLLVVLVFTLSIRLRQGELQTLHKLGCGKRVVVWLLVSELIIIFSGACCAATTLALVTGAQAGRLIQLVLG